MTTITVCDQCLLACCWKGIFMCDESREAGTIEKSTEELVALGREHSDYWDGTWEADDPTTAPQSEPPAR